MGAIAEGFTAFAQPLIDQTDGSHEQLSKALAIGQLCFNLAILPEDKRDTALSEMRPALQMDDEEFDEFRRSIVIPMIQRHQQMFPLMHRRDSTDSWLNGPMLQTQPTMAVSAETHPRIDRYAPCPCNSGEKYKFCCGKKGR
jgi:SEC-C motif